MELKNKIKNLEQQLSEEKNKNKELIKQINDLNSQIQTNDIKFKQILEEKEKELKKLIEENKQLKLGTTKSKDILFMKPGEKVIYINFQSTDQTIFNYSLYCKNTDLFIYVEEKLNEDFPKLKDKHYYLVNRGNIVKRFKSIDENDIKNNDVISIMDYSSKN